MGIRGIHDKRYPFTNQGVGGGIDLNLCRVRYLFDAKTTSIIYPSLVIYLSTGLAMDDFSASAIYIIIISNQTCPN